MLNLSKNLFLTLAAIATTASLCATPETGDPTENAGFDLRVEEFVKSKWGQENNSGYAISDSINCYNRFTPNNYPCGCVATAMAQLMRYHRYPQRAKAVTLPCMETPKGTVVDHTISGTDYDWDNMPLIPEAYKGAAWYDGGSTVENCEAIGKLTYECGIALQMHWGSSFNSAGVPVSSTSGMRTFSSLSDIFFYSNACGYVSGGNIPDETLIRLILPNLDAGYPVLIGMGSHEAVADGYGFLDGTPYIHLNMGYDGREDEWRRFSDMPIQEIIYNIFPEKTGELLSGRILNTDDIPLEGVLVSVALASDTDRAAIATTRTNERGIYSFLLPSDNSYVVTATYGKTITTEPIQITRSVNPTLQDNYYHIIDMACGNSWGNDIKFEGITSVATPVFTPGAGSFHPETNVFITCATEGATIHYTLDGSTPDETSPVFAATSPIHVTEDTTIKACAFKEEMAQSMVAKATYIYDYTMDGPPGDYYINPMRISESSGSIDIPDIHVYTLEDGEPQHSLMLLDDNTYFAFYQYHSAWYAWTAPGSGTITFNSIVRYGTSPQISMLAAYIGNTMATAERIAFCAKTNSWNEEISFHVEKGATYHIVGASFWDPYHLSMQLSWHGDLDSDPEVVQEASSYEGIYDGKGHGIDINVIVPSIGTVTKKYALSEDGPYSEDPILFTNATDATVWYIVEADGYRKATGSATVKIAKKEMTDEMVFAEDAARIYDGAEKMPPVAVADGKPSILTSDDYDVVYSDNVNAGEATITITAKRNYTGSQVLHFQILPKTLTDDMVSASDSEFGIKDPDVTVADGEPSILTTDDYDVSFERNGILETTVIVSGKGNYAGEVRKVVGILIPGSGTVTVPKTWKKGQKVTWKATAAKGSVFAHWEGEFVDSLGLPRNQLRNPSLQFAVPENFDPNGIRAVFISTDADTLRSLWFSSEEPLALNADVVGLELKDDSESYVTASASGLPSGVKFDAKTMAFSGKPKKAGNYTVKVTAKNTSGFQWAENLLMRVSDESVVPEPVEPKRTAFHPLTTVSMNPDMGTATGTGVYAEGKKVSISAKAAKNCVFAGWYLDAAFTHPATFASGDWKSASQSVVVPEARYLFAKFVTIDEDKTSIKFFVNGLEMAAAPTQKPMWVNYCGVAIDWPLAAEALSATTVKASGLPAGIKLVQDKVTKAYSLSGAPTAASKSKVVNNETLFAPSSVKLTVATAGKASQTFEVNWVILPLPAWAQGTFDGDVWESENLSGTVSATISTAGKFSGKMLENGRTWTLSAPSFYAAASIPGSDGNYLAFIAQVIGKTGKLVFTNAVAVVEQSQRGVMTSSLWTAYQNLWKADQWKNLAKPFAKAKPLTLYLVADEATGLAIVDALQEGVSPYGTLTIKFAATGVASTSAKFVTGKNDKGKDIVYSASCSSVLIPASGETSTKDYTLHLYFPPKAGKFEGSVIEVPVIWNGEAFYLNSSASYIISTNSP